MLIQIVLEFTTSFGNSSQILALRNIKSLTEYHAHHPSVFLRTVETYVFVIYGCAVGRSRAECFVI